MKLPFGFLETCRQRDVIPTRFALVVSVANQTVSLFENSSLRSGGRQTTAFSGSLPRAATKESRFAKKFPAPPRALAPARRKARIARRLVCIASWKKSAAAGRSGPSSKAANPLVTLGRECRTLKSPRAFCGSKDLNPALIAAAMWIRTAATFTSTARAMRRR
jgi:hypothetical protein